MPIRAKKSPALFQSASNAGVLNVVMLPLFGVLAQSSQARLSLPPRPSPVRFVPPVGMGALQSRGAAPPLPAPAPAPAAPAPPAPAEALPPEPPPPLAFPPPAPVP